MKLVLLDRDGVINVNLKNSVRTIDEFKLIPSSAAAIGRLNESGIKVVVVTNQAVVGRGEITLETLTHIHEFMGQELAKKGAFVDHIIYCTDSEPSPRRKPSPGMVFEALKKYDAVPDETPFVGDSLRDLQAAERAGCIPILVKTGNGQKTREEGLPSSLSTCGIFKDLEDFVTQELKENTSGEFRG